MRCGRCCGTCFQLSPVRRRGCGSAAALPANQQATPPADQAPPPADEKGPPLPFITIEGQGGGAITPMAYLVNPASAGEFWGKPSVAFDMIGLDGKNLDTFLLSENLFGRIDFGFAADDPQLGHIATARSSGIRG